MVMGFAGVQAQTLPPAQEPNSVNTAPPPSTIAVSRLYGGIEYLLWWVKDAPLSVPLVSTGPEANNEAS